MDSSENHAPARVMHEMHVPDQRDQAVAQVPDVAELREAPESVRVTEEQFRTLANAIPQLCWMANADGGIFWYNERWYEYTGTTPEQMEGWGWQSVHNPETLPAVLERWKSSIATGEPFDMVFPLKGADGIFRPFLTRVVPIKDALGKVVRWFGTNTDVTELREAQEALRASEQRRFSLVLQDVSEYAIVFLEPDGRVASWNKGAEAIKGYRAEEIIGQHFSKFYTPDDLANGKPAYELQIASAEGRFEDEDWRVRKDGSRFWANVVITALRDDKRQVNGFVKITRDLTERKRAEDEIKRYAEDLRRSNQELEHFAYVASHDLQEPLRTVGSFSQLLARRYTGKLDADADEFINFIVEGATRMQTLINDLLTFSRVGTRRNPFAPVAAEQVIDLAMENLDAAIAESGAVITHDPLPTVSADQIQLTQLFQNLFGNALKFRRPHEPPRIHVFAARQDGAWQFNVRDNGIGIDPRFFDRIFVIFQRLHGREEYSGTGIGLAICKKIVERHGGRIWVESAPGAGSTFHFTIPDERMSYESSSSR